MRIYIAIIIFGLVSCKPNKSKDSSENYRHIKGKIIENLGDTIQLIDGVDLDSISEHIFSKGHFYRDLRTNQFVRTGWHTFYNDENVLTQKVAYYNTIENSFLTDNVSQIINYSDKGDTIKGTSSFFELKTNFDSILKLADTLKIKIEINPSPQTMKVHGKFEYTILNSHETVDYEVKSTQPFFKYDYCPDKTGDMSIRGIISYYSAYGQQEDVDSLLQNTMTFSKIIRIIE